jgi:hypothetical protein
MNCERLLNCAAIPFVLLLDSRCFGTAPGYSGFVNASNSFWMSMFCGDNLLASISQLLYIPDDTLQKSLERTWGNIAIQSDRFRVFALYAGEQPLNVNPQQFSTGRSSKTICKLSQKPGEQFAELCDTPYSHGATFRGFLVKLFSTRRVVSFCPSRQHQ